MSGPLYQGRAFEKRPSRLRHSSSLEDVEAGELIPARQAGGYDSTWARVKASYTWRHMSSDSSQATKHLRTWTLQGTISMLLRSARCNAVMALARTFVGFSFMNAVYDNYISWRFMQQPEVKWRTERWPAHYPAISFPHISLFVLLPCAVFVALGVKVLWTAGVLAAWQVCSSAHIVAAQLAALLLFGVRPNELVVKRLALLGSVGLVLASTTRQHMRLNSYAGLLVAERRDILRFPPGALKSSVLLLGRLLMSAMFVFVGLTQIQRVIDRDLVLFTGTPHAKLWERDGHDNNWLLLEFALAMPLAVGFKTSACAWLLALTLMLEAATCWPWWASWPTQAYFIHVKLHFFTNLGVAGGLMLLGSVGPGHFSLDELLRKKCK